MRVVDLEPKYHCQWDNTNFFIYHANKGEGHSEHEHPYAHAVACFAGKIKVTKEKISVVLTSENEPVRLKENEWHEIEALEDNTIFMNIHSVDRY